MSGSAVAAAFVTMAIVFMVGLFIMCLMKKMHGAPSGGVRLKKSAMKGGHRADDISAADIPKLLNSMKNGSQMGIVLHMASCGYCKKLIGEVIMPMSSSGKLPMPMHMLEVNQGTADAAKNIPQLQTFMKEASGVPATMIIKKEQGKLHYAPMVGYVDASKLHGSIESAMANMKNL